MSKRNFSLQDLANSRLGIGFALAVGKFTPRWLGYRIADLGARLAAAQRGSSLVQALRNNQWVISGGQLSGPELDQAVYQVLRSNGRCLYDFYHNLERPKEVLRLVTFDPQFQHVFDLAKSGSNPTLFVIPHLSNFDLAGRSLALRGLNFQVLSFPQPPGGYQLQNRLRMEAGMEVTPMSIEAAQKAKERLRGGGVVLTGLDRPLQATKRYPRFFGRPAALPVAYVHLALQTQAPIIVVACVSQEPGKYTVVSRPPVIPQPHPNREVGLLENAEAVLREAEVLIRQYPRQWSMFYPVWPEAAAGRPAGN